MFSATPLGLECGDGGTQGSGDLRSAFGLSQPRALVRNPFGIHCAQLRVVTGGPGRMGLGDKRDPSFAPTLAAVQTGGLAQDDTPNNKRHTGRSLSKMVLEARHM